jgi:hypothetical protein
MTNFNHMQSRRAMTHGRKKEEKKREKIAQSNNKTIKSPNQIICKQNILSMNYGKKTDDCLCCVIQ